MRDEDEPIALAAEDASIPCLAQTGGALCDSVEHRLNVRRRVRDDAQDLGGRRLLVARLTQRAPKCFDLGPQIPVRLFDRGGITHGRPAPRAELSVGYGVVLLAPKTLHAASGVWAADGQNRGSRLDFGWLLVNGRRSVQARGPQQIQFASWGVTHRSKVATQPHATMSR